MKDKWLLLLVVGLLLVGLVPFSAYGKTSYFGVPNQALGVPPEFDQTDRAINEAEKSPGARSCPEKIAEAKQMAKEGAEAYWQCRTVTGLAMMAKARQMAEDAEHCGPRAAAPARQVVAFHSVYFDFNKAILKPEAIAELDKAAKEMQDNPDVVLELAGHTDNVGSEAYNKGLGERRAFAVFEHLKDKGVAGNRLKVVSYGKDNPVASNANEAGRAKNRRVDLVILK
jgi:outer membrane protein OmpA-like peptidoglycan-associated protein